jgi:quercetin dioxygenase-like cupin family protein
MTPLDWNRIGEEQMSPVLRRRVIHSQRITVAKLHLAKGATVPTHAHENEQVTMIERGCLRFVLAGEVVFVRGGEVLVIPPNVPHSAEAVEDTTATDLFSPPRADWMRGDDAYLRG